MISTLCLGSAACSIGADEGLQSEDWDVTADMLEQQERQTREFWASALNIENPPNVARIRYVSVSEWSAVQVDCLAESGIDARVSQEGIAFGDYPREQIEIVDLATYTCHVQYPMDPRANMKLPRVRAQMQYDHLVNTLAPCLEAAGWTVPEPPTLQTWLETYYADAETWDPMTAVPAEDLDDAHACPQRHPDLYPPLD